ncbi:nucleotidyltransferase domain-containing protein [Streptomyces sp. NRRL B-1381]|uniref:nucleotidyltransferase domain-containing protein n=1 Tax=Streptomyces sp. NRRL B-1381 TaxID=1463829 RepID=UPI0004BF4797|nr:nucleotidyltransferase domain-containing protein [Streptomyces sp. NRRL B-1381]
MDVREITRALVLERHPDARAAFLGGSVLTDRRTARSDLDVVVLLGGPPAPYRESLRHGGWPVELFVHTEDTWHDFVTPEIAQRNSALLWMCADGALVLDADGTGARLAETAKRLATAGPPPVTETALEDARYALTDLLDDVAVCGDAGERLFVVTDIARRTAELALLTHGTWLGGGKWLARRLEPVAPALAARLDEAARAALTGAPESLVAVATEVLDAAGGPVWEGYRRSGPRRTA